MNRILLTTVLIFSSIFNVIISGKEIKCGTNAIFCKNKNRCECKHGFIGDPNKKCINYDEACQLNLCGPHSICISNMSDPKVLKLGPYCICEDETHGMPPKCKKLCTFNLECNSHEYCNDDYCEDICNKDRCGPNSKCEGEDHEIYCSCVTGFIPKSGLGCQKKRLNEIVPQFNDDSTLFCSNFCAENADCGIIDEKLFCSCNSTIYGPSNPFRECEDFEVVDRFQIPSAGCECCSENLKPGCEIPLDSNIIKTLIG
ncbi:hypothetical protein PVAND_007808 [Polypedilum vanderplanki]|uniref:EGF-like domain-containing protein n=1 Tax=Polypedilum vanderplanki TaxID=319348 RepID=A0A9J6C8J4_POLVA|nr:hypothetical protein PVAND_007808 [Polypedilum vanderplanki]